VYNYLHNDLGRSTLDRVSILDKADGELVLPTRPAAS